MVAPLAGTERTVGFGRGISPEPLPPDGPRRAVALN